MPKATRPGKSFTLLSPAKLNLALQVVGREPDGFHLLNTLFERIDLSDRMVFLPADKGIQLSCDHPGVPLDGRNLVVKAALALREETGVSRGARIRIIKKIPVAAGLAGGSSNAATALLGLNRLWDLKLPRETLLRLARKIGSDVAFFLHDTPFARGTGRGDRIRPLEIAPRYWHVLITAKQPLLTKDVYEAYASRFLALNEAGLTIKSADVTMLIRSLKNNDVPSVKRLLFNDLQGPIGVLRPALLKLKTRVERLAGTGVCFSGSGPSIFALTATRAESEKIAAVFRRQYKQVFVVRTA
ncbi:MAG: 4-(cytidine 5'-diphospho)-2-C-methyl-D-erythritol kinase [Candidatus Omnitrophota bacterium]